MRPPGLSHVFKLILALVGATTLIVACCASSPIPSPNDPWWFNPCEAAPIKLRHGRSAHEDILRVHLDIVIRALKMARMQIKAMYGSKHVKVRAKKFRWINTARLLRDLGNAHTNKTFLKQFHKALQYFDGYFHEFQALKINKKLGPPPKFDQEKRVEIYNDATFNLRSLTCRVVEVLRENSLVPQNITLEKMKIPKLLKKEISFTSAFNYDLSLIKRAFTFFKKARTILLRKSRTRKLPA